MHSFLVDLKRGTTTLLPSFPLHGPFQLAQLRTRRPLASRLERLLDFTGWFCWGEHAYQEPHTWQERSKAGVPERGHIDRAGPQNGRVAISASALIRSTDPRLRFNCVRHCDLIRNIPPGL